MTDFHGLPTLILKNDHLQVEVLKDAGPRIVRLTPAGTDLNLLADQFGVVWDVPTGKFIPFGGHRLWRAPEVPEITYLRDDTGCSAESIPDGLCLSHDSHGAASYRRILEIRLNPHTAKLTLIHRIQNLGQDYLIAAPWAITQCRMGGRAWLPMTAEKINGSDYTPNRSLVLWPYTDLKDERLIISGAGVEVKGSPKVEALKVGLYSKRGWAAVDFAEGWTLVKRFTVGAGSDYADLSANVQCYVRDLFIELETLGELKKLAPGESVEHVEEWEIIKGSLDALGLR
jgi:hypothetical protein